MSSLKQKLANDEFCLGGWITLAHPAVAEIFARAGFDWIAIDLEHSTITIREAEELIRVVDLCGVSPLVRVTSNDCNLIKRVMDAGAHGIIVPMVNSADDAQRAVAAAYYAPAGNRGVGLARAQGYGNSFQAYRKWAEAETTVIVQVEHHLAVKNLEPILTTPGVDGYFLGPYDLSASLGIPGQFTHPDFLNCLETVTREAKRLKKTGGIHIVEPNPSEIKKRHEEGFRFIAYSLDTRFLEVSCRLGVSSISNLLEKKVF